MDLPEFNFDMVELVSCYMDYIPQNVNHETVKLKEVMCLKAKISQVKKLAAGSSVSYGLKYKCDKRFTFVATLPIGYADGYTKNVIRKSKSFG